MMSTKTVAFEVETGEEIEIEIEWSHSFTPGRQYLANGDPGYPDECETEIVLPEDLEKQLIDYFKANVLPGWVETIENRCTILECDGEVSEWARDEAEAYEAEREDR